MLVWRFVTRRKALLSLTSAAAASRLSAQHIAATKAAVKPPALREGQTVGIISPSTQVTDPDRIQRAQVVLDALKLKPKWGRSVRTHKAQGVATVAERVDDIHEMFADNSVSAVFCIRGGYGAGQLLAGIDYNLVRAHPKIFVGYSDVTALHLAFRKMTGLVTFHGPVLLSDFTPYTFENYRRALFSRAPLGTLANPPEANPLQAAHHVRTVHGGKAKGPLVGGNLTLISTLMGTPFEIETTGHILFTEDVGEEPYRIDRMLTQLRLSHKLQDAAGIVFGECQDCRPNDYKPSFAWNMTFGEVLDDRFARLNVPVLSGLTIGHTGDQLTLPLGVIATVDADRGTLTIEETATS